MGEESKIKDAADAVKGVLEAVPVYQDALQPAAKELGKSLLTVSKVVNMALAPISLTVWGYEKIRDYLQETLTEKLKRVPPEQIVQPKLTIAGPVVEQLRFAASEPSLRELYASLLATAMDMNTAGEAHPAFVDIIRQLTPDEAHILRYMSKKRSQYFPALTGKITISIDNSHHVTSFNCFSLLARKAKCQMPELVQSYTDNLLRLRLIEALDTDSRNRGHQLSYIKLEELANKLADKNAMWKFEKLEAMGQSNSVKVSRTDDYRKQFIFFTSFGGQFCNACIKKGRHS